MRRVDTPARTILILLFWAVASMVTASGAGTAGRGEPVAHQQVKCSDCHATIAGSAQDAAVAPTPNQRCRGCHALQSAEGNRVLQAFHGNPDRDCADCHSYHDPRMIKAGERRFVFRFHDESLRSHCACCHTGERGLSALSEGHQAAAEFYHSDYQTLVNLSPSQGCLTCHERDAGYRQVSFALLDIPRFSQHASHPVGVPVIPGKGNSSNQIRWELDSRIQLFGNRMECRTCHDLTNQEDDMLVRFETKYALCQGCHQHNS